jgi:hypothetical protein
MPPRPNVPAKRPVAEAQEAAWVADEDRFVLQQAKKKAAIRAKSGRALPIDWLAMNWRMETSIHWIRRVSLRA